MEKLYADDGKQVEFLVVYVREAHPTDGWQLGINEQEDILFAQPKSFEDRLEVAHEMCTKLEISIPTLIDAMDNQVGTDYAAFPDRLYLIGRDGTITYKGGPGPLGFKPAELRKAIAAELGGE